MHVRSQHEDQFRVDLSNVPDLEALHLRIQIQSSVTESYVIPFKKIYFEALNCSPPTPVSDLDRYTQDINNLHSRISQTLSGVPAGSLIMGPFAQATNALANYLNTMPDEFCIGPSNQAAFDGLNNATSNAVATVNSGVAFFEGNFERFVNQAIPLLNNLYNLSVAIDSTSRDFTQVLAAAQSYDRFANQYQLDVWNLSQKIINLGNQWKQAFDAANTAFNRAIYQIENNVESEAQRFVDQLKLAEDAFRHWDSVDGKQGYERYYGILWDVAQVMIPAFNAFLDKVPATDRVNNAVARAQQSIDQIDTGFNSFPNFESLPADSSEFPHLRYGSEDRKYGGSQVISAIKSITNAYNTRVAKKLYVGDMQYQHGGKMGIHKSHKNGNDGDVDGVEIGDIPNHDAVKALALAKEILSSGAKLVFYASQTTIDDANSWATQNGINGRLQYEENHTKHFHLRMPD